MKHLKRAIAMVMALSMLSTMGVSAYADDSTQLVDVDETINDDWGRVTLTGEVTSVEDGKVTVQFDGNTFELDNISANVGDTVIATSYGDAIDEEWFEYAEITVVPATTTNQLQKTFYTGDVNLDGEVDVLDLLTLKKMVLGITDMYQMYIDGDSLKLVEDEGEVVTINVTDDTQETQKTFYTGDVNLDGKVNVLDVLTLKKMLLGLTDMSQMYIDGDSLKLVEDEDEGEEVTIIVTGYEIDLGSQTININGVDGKLQELTLKFTDSTEYNGEFTNLSELANMVISCETYPLQSDPNLAITYDTATNEVLKCYQIEYSYQQPTIVTTYSMSVSFGDNSLSIAEGDPIQYMVTDDTTITLCTNTEETITFEELKEAYQTADGYMELEINYYYNETSQQYEVSSIKAYYIDLVTTTNTITINYGDSDIIQNIDNTERCIEIGAEDADGSIPLYATDDTTYSGLVSSFDDLEEYQSCYLDVMTTSGECVMVAYTWTITYHVTDRNVIDSIDVSITTAND